MTLALPPYRERQLLRWQEAERERVSGKNAAGPNAQSAIVRYSSIIKVIWQTIITIILGVSGTASAILCIALFAYSIFARIVVIQPISVPKSVSEDGLTADVAASRLKDAVDELAKRAQTARPLPRGEVRRLAHGEIMRQADVLDVTVPSVGISIQSLSAQIRAFLGMQSHQIISSEITSRSGLHFINVRLNGAPLFATQKGVEYEHLADLFTDAASAVLRATQPCIFAAFLSDTNKTAALELVDTIIYTSPCTNRDPIWAKLLETVIYISPCTSEDPISARILKGNILDDLGRRDEAMAELTAAIALDPKDALAHDNLGNVLDDLGRREEAMAEYKVAIALDPQFASPHNDLGNVLDDLGRREDAMAEYKSSIALDPISAPPHNNLGIVLNVLGQREEAMAQYKAAINLDPKYAIPHDNLGSALNGLGRRDEAMAEFKVAIALDPKFVSPHIHLGSILDELGRHEEAMAEYKAAESLSKSSSP